MAKFKILGGEFSERVNFADSKATKLMKEGKIKTATSIQAFVGSYLFCIEVGSSEAGLAGWFGQTELSTDTVPSFLENIEEIQEVTEDNKVNFTGAAGWGIVGGVLTGGVGLLAGMLLGGRGKSTVFVIRLKDGSQFLCSGKTKDYAELLADSNKF